MADVILSQLTKTYPDRSGAVVNAVKGIDLTIADGEFMVLVGPSGCGKSTTLRMVAGLEAISSGTVSIDGRIVNDIPPKDRDIAMVFQNYALYPHMTVRENLAFGLRLRSLPRAEIDRRVQEAATLLQIEQLLDRLPKALSGGQRQRVAVGRAIVRQPKVFLFDEPLSNLDAKMRVSTRAEIAKLHDRLGATMIYVTHDQVEAMTLGDRICVMKDGRIMQVADPLTLYHDPANTFVAGFIGSPPTNLVTGKIERDRDSWWFREVSNHSTCDMAPIRIRLPNDVSQLPISPNADVVLGMRPEHLAISSARHSEASFETKVELVEPLGAESYYHLRSAGHSIVARINEPLPSPESNTAYVTPDSSRMLLFDASTGNRLRLLREQAAAGRRR